MINSKVYPVQSPRGADIIISGYDDGLHIIWRGGPLLSERSRTITESDGYGSYNQKEWNDAVSITRTVKDSEKPLVMESVLADDKPSYESETGELDEEEPYPAIVQELKLSLGSPVLRLATPDIPSSSSLQPKVEIPLIVELRIVVVAACADGSVRLITLPLTPPSASTKRENRLGSQICTILPPKPFKTIPRDVSLSWTSRSVASHSAEADNMDLDEPSSQHHRKENRGHVEDDNLDLLVAVSASGTFEQVHLVRVPIAFDKMNGGQIPTNAQPFRTLNLPSSANHVSFNPSPYPSRRHSQLLIADAKGCLKVYDPFAADSARSRPSSRDSGSESVADLGGWVVAFQSGFQMPKDTMSSFPGLAQRRRFIDASWVCGGRSIVALLDDGEWGVWDVEGGAPKSNSSSTTASLTDFAIRGFIGDTSGTEASITSEAKSRAASRLAPMTPNTRKSRQESLFTGAAKHVAGAAIRGGLSAAVTTGSHGTTDDSVILWYGSEAYHIPSLQSLWQRSLSSSGRDIGSLYGPGLSRIEGLDLSGEVLNSIDQFSAKASAVNVGNITQRDFLITGEHRLIITTPTRPQTPAKSLFARENGSPVTQTFDQQLLDRGELDLGGMDRLLDNMTGIERTNGLVKNKRVGFAR